LDDPPIKKWAEIVNDYKTEIQEIFTFFAKDYSDKVPKWSYSLINKFGPKLMNEKFVKEI